MICLRCGYCCINLDVAIVNPESIRLDGTVDPDDNDPVLFKPAGERCLHLVYKGDEAVCTIHDLKCYSGSSCEQFEQFGREDDICVMGAYFKIAKDGKRLDEIIPEDEMADKDDNDDETCQNMAQIQRIAKAVEGR